MYIYADIFPDNFSTPDFKFAGNPPPDPDELELLDDPLEDCS